MTTDNDAVLDTLAVKVANHLARPMTDKLNDIHTAVGMVASVLDDLLQRNQDCEAELRQLRVKVEDLQHALINRETALNLAQSVADIHKARTAKLTDELVESKAETGMLRRLKDNE